jgi:hypothetical protein
MSKVSDFVERVKTERDAQILVVGILFFTVAFPTAFAMAASNVESGGLTAVGDYVVNGEVIAITLEDGGEYIADGDTWSFTQHSDSERAQIQAAGGNVIGLRITLTYDEDETVGNAPICIAPGQDGADTISASLTHGEHTGSGDGTNPGSHTVNLYWVNETLLQAAENGDVISDMSGADISEQLDAGDAGLGEYDIEVGVTAETGNAGPGCSREDNGEQVDWVVEVLVLDFSVAPYLEVDPTL